MLKDEKGSVVVEVIGAFLPFVFLLISILSLVNIVTVQARVHYAMTQTANILSMYSYVFHVTGTADYLQKMDKISNEAQKEIDAIKGNINGVLGGMNDLSLENAITNVETVVDDGKSAITGTVDLFKNPTLLVNYGLNEGRNALTAELVRSLVARYLVNGDLDAHEYLRSTNVNVIGGLNGLRFYSFDLLDLGSEGRSNSVLINEDYDIVLVVNYDIEYKFWTLPLPFEPKLNVTQTVKTKAWLGGRDKGYPRE